MRGTCGFAAVVMLSVACGGKQSPKPALANGGGAPGPGCPAGVTPRLVERVASPGDEAGAVWGLFEVNLGETPDAAEAYTVEITAEQARAAGASSTDDPVWLLTGEGDGAPCKAMPGRFLSVTNGDAIYETRLFRELRGCDAAKASVAWPLALQTTADAAGCRLSPAVRVSARYVDAGEPVPPADVAALLPPADCQPPCQPSWWVYEAAGAGTRVLLVDHATVTPDPTTDSDCEWPWEGSWFFAVQPSPSAPLARWEPLPDAEDEGRWDQPRLDALLHDAGGARWIVLEQPGTAWLIQVTAGAPGVAQRIDAFHPHEETFAGRGIIPSCL